MDIGSRVVYCPLLNLDEIRSPKLRDIRRSVESAEAFRVGTVTKKDSLGSFFVEYDDKSSEWRVKSDFILLGEFDITLRLLLEVSGQVLDKCLKEHF